MKSRKAQITQQAANTSNERKNSFAVAGQPKFGNPSGLECALDPSRKSRRPGLSFDNKELQRVGSIEGLAGALVSELG